MDINNICFGCMEEKLNNTKFCTKCGYCNGSQENEHYYLEEGTILANRYLIGKVLGHGGFGITYIGFDQRLEVRVAIKEYLPSDVATRAEGQSTIKTFSGDKKEQFDYGLTRFLDEAKSLARYNQHPCIVSTTDYFEENNTAYIVMEYLNGIPLNEYLKRKGGKIPFEAALEIMMPIMDALREVHGHGMIHRDVSPDNIYITSKGQVKLLDFGAARFALGEKSKSLSVILKPGFAPPEQYTSKGKQGSWTDVYSVAATMYRMLMGKNLPEAMDRMMEPYIKLPDNLTNNIKETFIHALQVKHEERIRTIQELQNSLNSVVSNKPLPVTNVMPEKLNNQTSVETNKKNIQIQEKKKKNKVFIPILIIIGIIVIGSGIGIGIMIGGMNSYTNTSTISKDNDYEDERGRDNNKENEETDTTDVREDIDVENEDTDTTDAPEDVDEQPDIVDQSQDESNEESESVEQTEDKPDERPEVTNKYIDSNLDIIETQSFPATFENFGDVHFVSCIDNKKHTVYYYLTDSTYRIIVELPHIKRYTEMSVLAVTFSDINEDGLTDILLMTECTSTSKTSDAFSYSEVYFQYGYDFVNIPDLDSAINNAGRTLNVFDSINYITENITNINLEYRTFSYQ